MEETKVGDYIRTKQWGIAKVAKINKKGECTHIKNKNDRITHYFEQIGKTSSNIIDLIRCGDYVNGQYAFDVFEKDGQKVVKVYCMKGYICENEIGEIVTKEQFNSIKYEVK